MDNNDKKLPEKSEPSADKGRKGFKAVLSSPKFKHGGAATALTAVFIVLIILLNVVVSVLADRFPSMNLDLTANSVNTLSEEAAAVVDNVSIPATIYIMLDEETAKQNQQYSQVTQLAAKMSERNGNISVQYVDLDKNPGFTTNYQNEGLSSASVLVETEKRHRVLSYSDLFTTKQNQQTGESATYSLVDSALASALNAVIAETLPVVAFETGHQEMLDPTNYKTLLGNNNFESVEFSLLTDEIPENTQLLVLATPATDYTDKELDKIDNYLNSTDTTMDRAMMVTLFPSQPELTTLNTFLNEWGVDIHFNTLVSDSDQNNYYFSPTDIFSKLNTEIEMNDKANYGKVLMPTSVPVDRLWEGHGDVSTYSLATSYETAVQVDAQTGAEVGGAKEYDIATLSQKYINYDGKNIRSSIVTLGSSMMFVNGVINASAFSNESYVLDLTRFITGTTDASAAIYSKQVQTITYDINMTAQQVKLYGLWIFTIGIPVLIAVFGVVVFLKRRHL